MTSYSHLSDRAKQALCLDPEGRWACAKSLPFIPTRDCVVALRWMSYQRRYSSGFSRAHGTLVVGAPGMGKSMLLGHYMSLHGQPYQSGDGRRCRSAVAIEAPIDGDPSRLRDSICHACLAGLGSVTLYDSDVVSSLHSVRAKQLLIDEAGNLLHTGPRMQQKSLALLKKMSNAGIAIVLATTTRLNTVIALDEQLNDRFRRVELRSWIESNDLRSFLDAVERELPLPEPSYLSCPEIIRWIIGSGLTRTGVFMEVIFQACHRAFLKDWPCLSLKRMEEALDDPLPPD